jgi:hypothetical protein
LCVDGTDGGHGAEFYLIGARRLAARFAGPERFVENTAARQSPRPFSQ